MSKLPSEVWGVITQQLRQPIPPAGREGTTWTDLHQQDLANLMRVSTTTHHGIAPVLYSEVVVNDISRLYIGVDVPRSGRTCDIDASHSQSHDISPPASASDNERAISHAPRPIHKLRLLGMIHTIHYVYSTPTYHWGHFLDSNTVLQAADAPIEKLFHNLKKQTFCAWSMRATPVNHSITQRSQRDVDRVASQEPLGSGTRYVNYPPHEFQYARFDFQRHDFRVGYDDAETASSTPVPIAPYRCVNIRDGGPLVEGWIGRRWYTESTPAVINAVHGVHGIARVNRRHLVPGAINHIYLDPRAVQDEEISPQFDPRGLEALVREFFSTMKDWIRDSVKRNEVDDTTVSILVPRPSSSHIIYADLDRTPNEDLERINACLRRNEVEQRSTNAMKPLATDTQQIKVVWAEEEPWCMACGRVNQLVTGPRQPGPFSSARGTVAIFSNSDDDDDDDFFYDYDASQVLEEEEQEEDEVEDDTD